LNQLNITKNVLVLSIDEKKNSNLYSFVDLETNSVLTCLGVQENVELHKPIKVKLNIRITNELIEGKDGTRRFVNTSNLFVEGFEKVSK